MSVLQIVGNQSGAGKTSLAAAVLLTAQSAGKQAAYYKPYSSQPGKDLDISYVSQLLQSVGGPSVPNPRPLADASDAVAVSEVQAEVSRLESQADIVVIDGPDASAPYSLNSKVILVHRHAQQAIVGGIVTSINASKGFSGIVVNAVPIHRRDQVARELGEQPVPLAVIPESRGMLSITVEQLAEHLEGQWVLEPVNTDAPIEHFMIGGNILDSGPTYFGRYANQAIIIRVERPDIQMACMGVNTKCIVLAGPGEPTEYVKAEALQQEVPLIQVRSSTLDTAESLAGLLDKADARTAAKATHFAELLEQYMGAEALDRLLS